MYCGRRYVEKGCGPHPLMLQEGGVGMESSLRPGDKGRPAPWTPEQGSLNIEVTQSPAAPCLRPKIESFPGRTPLAFLQLKPTNCTK